MYVAKTKALISDQLICAFFSNDASQIIPSLTRYNLDTCLHAVVLGLLFLCQ